jgi:hypothetical protein
MSGKYPYPDTETEMREYECKKKKKKEKKRKRKKKERKKEGKATATRNCLDANPIHRGTSPRYFDRSEKHERTTRVCRFVHRAQN